MRNTWLRRNGLARSLATAALLMLIADEAPSRADQRADTSAKFRFGIADGSTGLALGAAVAHLEPSQIGIVLALWNTTERQAACNFHTVRVSYVDRLGIARDLAVGSRGYSQRPYVGFRWIPAGGIVMTKYLSFVLPDATPFTFFATEQVTCESTIVTLRSAIQRIEIQAPP